MTRLGYGSVPGSQPDAVKVLIGDALRNAAMRFGVALDLWAKGDRADPTAENATASAGRRANGNGRSNGQTVRPAANGAPAEPPGPKELDPDAQPYADEAHEARTLATLKDVNTRAREAHKLAALIANPSTGGAGAWASTSAGAGGRWRKSSPRSRRCTRPQARPAWTSPRSISMSGS